MGAHARGRDELDELAPAAKVRRLVVLGRICRRPQHRDKHTYKRTVRDSVQTSVSRCTYREERQRRRTDREGRDVGRHRSLEKLLAIGERWLGEMRGTNQIRPNFKYALTLLCMLRYGSAMRDLASLTVEVDAPVRRREEESALGQQHEQRQSKLVLAPNLAWWAPRSSRLCTWRLSKHRIRSVQRE